MGLFDFLKTTPATVEIKDSYSVSGSGVSDVNDLRISTNKKYHIYDFGIKNNFPKTLISLYDNSPTNQAIINRTALMIAGGPTQLEILDQDLLSVVHATQLQQFPNSKQNIEQIVNGLALDLKLHGRYAIECIWNEAHTRVVQLKHVSVDGVRVGVLEAGKVEKYWYSSDWEDAKAVRFEYQAFDKFGTESRQLLYVQTMRSGHEIYGLPDYYASMKWISLEAKIGTHYDESAENGFSPKMSVVFPAKPESEEIEDRIMDNLNRKYTGAKGRRIIGIFASRPEVKPEFNPIAVENLDKQYREIDEQGEAKILTGHGVVSPLLFGISSKNGFGSNKDELQTAFDIYQRTVVSTPQNMIQSSLDEILQASGNKNRIQLTTFDVVNEQNIDISEEDNVSKVAEALNSMSPFVASKVMDNLTPNEIRALGGLPGIEGGDQLKDNKNTFTDAATN